MNGPVAKEGHEAGTAIRRSQRPHQFRHPLQVAADDPEMADLAIASVFGKGDVDRFLVGIHPHERATFRHGLSPLYVALRVTLIGFA
jgi:hypothetical protein